MSKIDISSERDKREKEREGVRAIKIEGVREGERESDKERYK